MAKLPGGEMTRYLVHRSLELTQNLCGINHYDQAWFSHIENTLVLRSNFSREITLSET